MCSDSRWVCCTAAIFCTCTDPALTLHCLRHSYVTHLIEYGYADRFVQEQVGHMHASTTSIYASVSSDYKNRVLAEALKALIEGEADDR